jgi:hypothetical protein
MLYFTGGKFQVGGKPILLLIFIVAAFRISSTCGRRKEWKQIKRLGFVEKAVL